MGGRRSLEGHEIHWNTNKAGNLYFLFYRKDIHCQITVLLFNLLNMVFSVKSYDSKFNSKKRKVSDQNNGNGSGLIHIFCSSLPRYILIDFAQVKINIYRNDLLSIIHEAPPGVAPSTNKVIPSLGQVPLSLRKLLMY